jgi:hypothetical protein
MIILYVGPEQIMPIASALATIVGVLLMFWHRMVALGRRAWQAVTGKPAIPDSPGQVAQTLASEEDGPRERERDSTD